MIHTPIRSAKPIKLDSNPLNSPIRFLRYHDKIRLMYACLVFALVGI